VAALIAARIAGKTDDEIRALVAKLEAARKDAVMGCEDESGDSFSSPIR
jgi:hypothetical protein